MWYAVLVQKQGPCHNSGGQSLAFHCGGPGPIPSQVMCDLWWTKWHWSRCSPHTSVSPVISHSTNCSIFIIILHRHCMISIATASSRNKLSKMGDTHSDSDPTGRSSEGSPSKTAAFNRQTCNGFTTQRTPESESDLLYSWRFTANQFVLGTSSLKPMTRIFILQLNTCGYSPYVTSLWREKGSVVYNCCWFSPAQSISGPSPAGLMTTFYCLRFETLPTWRARCPYLYSLGTVSRLHAHALGSLFVASYDTQGYGGGIRPRLHTGPINTSVLSAYKSYWTSQRQTAQETCSAIHCLNYRRWQLTLLA
jgi:hypothetical protein